MFQNAERHLLSSLTYLCIIGVYTGLMSSIAKFACCFKQYFFICSSVNKMTAVEMQQKHPEKIKATITVKYLK